MRVRGSPTLQREVSRAAVARIDLPTEPMKWSGRPSSGGGTTRTVTAGPTTKTSSMIADPSPRAPLMMDPLTVTGPNV